MELISPGFSLASLNKESLSDGNLSWNKANAQFS
jgi:hypothetical protein